LLLDWVPSGARSSDRCLSKAAAVTATSYGVGRGRSQFLGAKVSSKSSASNTLPELLPARMLNEFVYCPRLFYLEWVDKQWADNRFTVDGSWQHRAVDEPKGKPHAATKSLDEDPPRSTAIEVSSEELGVVAKIDVMESSEGSVVPIDTKRGAPRDGEHAVHLPERIQVAAQVLILRDNGYEVPNGAVYFTEVRRRVRVDVDQELETLTRQAIADARRVAAAPEAPEPLVDSPKCNGCSLVGICLPDETRMLKGDRKVPPRRLLAPDSPSKPMYVTQPGLSVGKSARRVIVRQHREEVASARLVDVSQLCLFGNVQVSTQLVHLLMDEGIDVFYFSRAGWLKGVTSGLPTKNVELRRRQVLAVDNADLCAAVSGSIVEGKIRNQRTMLRRNGRGVDGDHLSKLLRLSRRARRGVPVHQLLGLEGSAARLYFSNFSRMLRPRVETGKDFNFDFHGRNRRPPRDPINALLSFSYALLTKDCLGAAMSVGLDPYLGVLHRPRFGRPALALDIAEEFRPIVADSVVLTAVNGGVIRPKHFIVRAGGVALTDEGRRKFLGAYERRIDSTLRHPIFGYEVTYRRALEIQMRLFAALLLGEIDHYSPLLTR